MEERDRRVPGGVWRERHDGVPIVFIGQALDGAGRRRCEVVVGRERDYAFYQAAELQTLVLPVTIDGPVRIGNFSFAECLNLTGFNLTRSATTPGTLVYIGAGAFNASGLGFVHFDASFDEFSVILELVGAIQHRDGGKSNASMTLFDACIGSSGTYHMYGVEIPNTDTVVLAECIFHSCTAAIGAEAFSGINFGTWPTGPIGQGIVESCLFANTSVARLIDAGGSVLLRNCLFAGRFPLLRTRVTLDGAQQQCASTRVEFVIGAMLEACLLQGPTEIDQQCPPPSASEELSAGQSASASRRRTPLRSPYSRGGSIIRAGMFTFFLTLL